MTTTLRKPARAKRIRRAPRRDPYRKFKEINGWHAFRGAVPDGYVDYPARKRRGGKVAYFNFGLAQEMGLIPRGHPHRLRRRLADAILDAFSLSIVNEYDVLHRVVVPEKELKPNQYMATRYLQLQHPSRVGKTSGDGRSIWNGQLCHRGVTWDISSCGTGATRLSPATAIEKKFFKTGDKYVSYGCGLADLSDGFNTAIMSGVFHKNLVLTERTLAIVEFEQNTAVIVRAGKNLLRPSHFFCHLKQGNRASLRAAVDYFVKRQVSNGDWKPLPARPAARYKAFARHMALTFARLVAKFENEYIFCWLDWDGDNILADGGIVDYGSVRQFGLYHHEYRYDDADRYSTTISEQHAKARYIVQTFAQVRDFVVTGRKRGLRCFRNDRVLRLFDRELERQRLEYLAYRLGFAEEEARSMATRHRQVMERFRRHFAYFERATSRRGVRKAADGITRDAIFCMRDILRELPVRLLRDNRVLTPEEFLDVIRSSYARRDDVKLTPSRRRHVRLFQEQYLDLARRAARASGRTLAEMLGVLARRSQSINRYDRITGDAVIHLSHWLLGERKRRSFDELHRLLEEFVEYQNGVPMDREGLAGRVRPPRSLERRDAMKHMIGIVVANRQGL